MAAVRCSSLPFSTRSAVLPSHSPLQLDPRLRAGAGTGIAQLRRGQAVAAATVLHSPSASLNCHPLSHHLACSPASSSSSRISVPQSHSLLHLRDPRPHHHRSIVGPLRAAAADDSNSPLAAATSTTTATATEATTTASSTLTSSTTVAVAEADVTVESGSNSKEASGADSQGNGSNGAASERVVLPTNESSEKLLRIRHTSAHVMAMAVQRLFPAAQVTIGPWIANGFFYDFDLKEALTDKELKRIKKEMDRIISRNLPLRCEVVSREEAARRITDAKEPYKLEILEGLLEPITIYHIGEEWWDLCAGPHVESTGQLPRRAIELESVAGAYWRGDEQRAMLQRIYGTAWESEEQLAEHKRQVAEAKRRDHRKLGKELGLFSIQESAGGGLVFWHPHGARVRNIIEDYWRGKHREAGYELLFTPHIAKLDLWKTSGHFDFYKENMFDQMEVEEEQYQIRPMNCPFHIALFNDGFYSYRDLPIRWAELGTVYRYERSGTMHGLFRVRGFTQDDAHIFCQPSQIREEIHGVLDLTEQILRDFGFTALHVNLSTRPEKYVGGDDIWETATLALREALQDKGWAYEVDEGGGAFYGPKIDIKIEDAIGRQWQCSTIQVDFNLPQRFNMEFVDGEGKRQRPIMIHRAVLGSLERFFGVLIENYAGEFPLWLAPVQLRLLPVTDNELPFCHQLVADLTKRGIRAQVASGERLGKLIRNAETQKVPVMGVVGAREVEANCLNVRTRKGGELGALPVAEVIARIEQAVANKAFL